MALELVSGLDLRRKKISRTSPARLTGSPGPEKIEQIGKNLKNMVCWSPGLILTVTCTIFRTGSVPGSSGARRGPGGPNIDKKPYRAPIGPYRLCSIFLYVLMFGF